MRKNVTRRQFLKLLAVALGAVGIAIKSLGQSSLAQSINRNIFLPWISGSKEAQRTATNTPTGTIQPAETAQPTGTNQPTDPAQTSTPTATNTPTPPGTPGPLTGKVVYVHDQDATSWDYITGWYGDYVNQDVINNMVDESIKQLTGMPSVTEAWQYLLPGYEQGKAIAIKVNFNNAEDCTGTGNLIDALIEPVNALIRGMKTIGVDEHDIWIFDASRRMPMRFTSRCLYPNVRFFDNACNEIATFTSTDPAANVDFAHPSLTNRRITDVIINAEYLISIPIIKDHSMAGVTLGFKNHFGTIDEIQREGEDQLHYYIKPSETRYSKDYNPLVEIYMNPHINEKTVLIVGDGLYGAPGTGTNAGPPRPWQIFGNNACNSLLFATDPVAIDSVMLDILDAEPIYHPQRDGASDYLILAASSGLGVFERGDPFGSGYSQIDFLKIEM